MKRMNNENRESKIGMVKKVGINENRFDRNINKILNKY